MISNGIRALARERATLAHGVTLISSEVTESVIDDRIFDYEYMTEKAAFAFLPRFKTLKQKYPELAQYEGTIRDADALLMRNGSSSSTSFGIQCCQLIMSITGIWTSIGTAVTLPFCIFVFPIINYLLGRLIVWGCDTAQFKLAENQIRKTIESINRLKASTTDEELKERCDKMVERLLKDLEKLQTTEHTAKESTIDYDLIYHSNMDDYMTESAKFSILPRFKTLKGKYPELGKYEGLVNEAQMLLIEAEHEPPKNFGTKCAKIVTTIFGVIFSIDSVIMIPFCIFIFPILYYLLYRCCVWACDTLQFAFAEKQITTSLQSLIRLKNSTTDRKLKFECEKLIKKLEKELRKLQGLEDKHDKNEFKKKAKEKSYRRESVDEDEIDFMAEFREELEDVDVDELVTRLGTIPDTTDEEIDRMINSEDPTPFTADNILLGDEGDGLTDDEIDDMLDF